MQSDIQEIYRQKILPLPEKERLKLAALIINDISEALKTNVEGVKPKREGGIREMFGTWSGGDPNGSDNDKIDADLARAYADTHEDE